MAILDCRDTRISLWEDGSAVHSPGFVLLDGTEYQFGDAAMAQSRLRPRDSSSRFWWQLGTQPLKPALGAARHTADLVHSHLRHLHRAAGAPEALTLAVPDSMPREQLSLLLGVAQACDFRVAGLVSRSVLLGSVNAGSGLPRLLHLEAQLNQAIINELVAEDGYLRLHRSTPLPACGLLALQERCVSAIAAAFIQQTRFDPRRAAKSEQLLYNQLPQILVTLEERGEVSVDIDGHRARVTAETLAGASDRLVAGLAQARGGEGVPLLIDPELRRMPGVGAIGGQVTALSDRALWDSWEHQQPHVELSDEDVHLIDRLPVRSGSNRQSSSPTGTAAAAPADQPAAQVPTTNPSKGPQVQSTRATHVLIGTTARPLRNERVELGGGFVLRHAQGHWTLHGDGALVNGLPSTSQQPLHLGDTLSLGTAGHGRLIEVVD